VTDPAVHTRIQVGVGCTGAEMLVQFWALDYEEHFIGGWQHAVWFQPVPERKVVKNRL
jgi:hypothetical protein